MVPFRTTVSTMKMFTVNRTSITYLEKLLQNQYKHDFNERSLKDKDEMPRDDMKFMNIMVNSCKFKDGYYTLELDNMN